MKKFIVLALAVLLISGCTRPEQATKALEGAGYTDIKLNGYSLSCGQDDPFADEFTAKGPTGKTVNGVVCSGFLKGSTIRID